MVKDCAVAPRPPPQAPPPLPTVKSLTCALLSDVVYDADMVSLRNTCLIHVTVPLELYITAMWQYCRDNRIDIFTCCVDSCTCPKFLSAYLFNKALCNEKKGGFVVCPSPVPLLSHLCINDTFFHAGSILPTDNWRSVFSMQHAQ